MHAHYRPAGTLRHILDKRSFHPWWQEPGPRATHRSRTDRRPPPASGDGRRITPRTLPYLIAISAMRYLEAIAFPLLVRIVIFTE